MASPIMDAGLGDPGRHGSERRGESQHDCVRALSLVLACRTVTTSRNSSQSCHGPALSSTKALRQLSMLPLCSTVGYTACGMKGLSCCWQQRACLLWGFMEYFSCPSFPFRIVFQFSVLDPL